MSRSSPLALKRGVSSIEFALVAWVLALLALATVDVVTYIRTDFRLEQVAAQMGEVITQCQAINSPGDTNRFMQEAKVMAGGLDITDMTGIGSFIITAIVPVPNSKSPAATIAWQYFFGNPLYGSSMCGAALTCSTGASATIPGGFSIPDNQVLIVTEVSASVQPFMFSAKFINASKTILHSNALFLVRSANPSSLNKVTVSTSTAQACGS